MHQSCVRTDLSTVRHQLPHKTAKELKFEGGLEPVFDVLTKPPYLDVLKNVAGSLGSPFKRESEDRSILL